mmetsp:Transcript_20823/g.35509  ORF Transcript_20823/g.35509 Transcript_20823/m.35509 type:complete len:96 (+) Transcript_20823:41-328(+)
MSEAVEEKSQVNPAENFTLPTTAPYDPRFSVTNQTKNCWTNYVDYHRCVRIKGEEDPQCLNFKKSYRALCPLPWTEKWDMQREQNIFPGQNLINK